MHGWARCRVVAGQGVLGVAAVHQATGPDAGIALNKIYPEPGAEASRLGVGESLGGWVGLVHC